MAIYNPMMKQQAAQMAVQRMDEDEQMPPKAPIVPTTNMRAPQMQQQQAPRPQPQMQPQMQQPQIQQPQAPRAPQMQPRMPQMPQIPQQPQGQQQNTQPISRGPAQPTLGVRPNLGASANLGSIQVPDVQTDAPMRPVGPDAITDKAPRQPNAEELTAEKDRLYQERLRELLGGGPRDTAGEEKLLREQMLRDVGANQAGLNARLAAGGGGASGALSALTTDMRSRAALDAARGIETVRENARGEYRDRVKTGIGAALDERGLEMDEARNAQMMELIKQMFPNAPVKSDGKTAPVTNSSGYEYTPKTTKEILDQGDRMGDDSLRDSEIRVEYQQYKANGGILTEEEYLKQRREADKTWWNPFD
jgi:hypothetical protein